MNEIYLFSTVLVFLVFFIFGTMATWRIGKSYVRVQGTFAKSFVFAIFILPDKAYLLSADCEYPIRTELFSLSMMLSFVTTAAVMTLSAKKEDSGF
ncbi:MAG: hypothetical protein UX75_C0023G0013 [Candidatus Moranbacteria bacterium GW2011_GWE2_47_10]|nr:MAG: hypothetical protein UX75_C0023G0013 [Candidatus Moranbacteria bacterium GW2011_GWE2_47_10]